jgi:hypothetical protein
VLEKVHVSRGSIYFPSFRHTAEYPEKMTICQILDAEGIAEQFWVFIRVSLNNEEIPRGMWQLIRPRAGALVSLGVSPAGDPGTALLDKGNLRLLGFLGSTIASTAVGALIGGPWGTILSAGLSILGIFLSSTFIKPPTQPLELQSFTISGTRNRLRPYGAVPRVYGKIRIYPDLCASPITEIQGEDQYINVLFCLGYKPLKISEIKIGEIPITDFKEVSWIIDDGWSNVPRRNSAGSPVDLYSMGLDAEEVNYDRDLLYAASWYGDNPDEFFERLPRGPVTETTDLNENVITHITQNDTVRFGLDLIFPQGLYNTNNNGDVSSERVDISIRYRPYGATGPNSWIYVYPSWVRQNITEEAEILTDSDLFQFLVATEQFIEETIALLEDIVSGERLISDSLRQYFVARTFGIRTAIEAMTNSGIYNNIEIISLNLIDTRILDLANQIDDSADVLENFGTELGQFNEILSAVINIIEFIDDGLALQDYIRRGAGPELTSFRPFFRWIIKKRNLERLFGPPATGAFVIVNEEARPGLFRRGVVVDTLPSKYEIQVRRTNKVVTEDDKVKHDSQIGAFRSFAARSPVSEYVKENMVLVGMRIKASSQISGTLDQFNVVAESPLHYYEDDEWKGPALVNGDGENVSKNPAWISTDILRGTACARPVASTNLDLSVYQEFAAHCNAKKLFFSGSFDQVRTTEEALQDVARVAKGSLTLRDGKFSVVYDYERTGYNGLITVRNSDPNFTATKMMTKPPDALRLKFVDPTKGYVLDEMFVYKDGYGPPASLVEVDRYFNGGADFFSIPFEISEVVFIKDTWLERTYIPPQVVFSYDDGVSSVSMYDPTEFEAGANRYVVRFKYQGITPENTEQIDIFGLIDTHDKNSAFYTGQVYQIGRYLLAAAELRPEIFTVTLDREYRLFTRGSRIKFQHDVVKWGHGGARINGGIVKSGTKLTAFNLDEEVTMESGKTYNVHLRTHKNAHLVGTATTVVGTSNTITLDATGIELGAEDVIGGELVAYGEKDITVIPCLVTSISPNTEGGATLTLVEDHPAIHNAENVIVPDYDPNISDPPIPEQPRPPAPTIVNVVTDESALIRLPNGQLVSRILMSLSIGQMVDNNQKSIYGNVAAISVQYRNSPTPEPELLFVIVGATKDLKSGENSWLEMPLFTNNLTSVSVDNVEDGKLYDVRVRAITEFGVPSEWSTQERIYVQGKLSPPPDVVELSLSGMELYWLYPNQPRDFAGFIVKQIYGEGGTWEIATPLHQGYVKHTNFTLPRSTGRARVLFVKAVDITGRESVNAARLVTDLGDIEVGNVIEILDQRALGWPGDKYKFEVVSPGQLEEMDEDDGCFYRAGGGGLPFYIGGVPFYQRTYPGGIYTVTVDASDYTVPFFLSVDMVGSGDEYIVQYRIPNPVIITAEDQMLFHPTGAEQFFPVEKMNWQMLSGAIRVTQEEVIEIRVVSYANDIKTVIEEMKVILDVNDVREEIEDFVVSDTGTVTLPLTKNFQEIRSISLTLQSSPSHPDAMTVQWVNKNVPPEIVVLDNTLARTSGVIDAIVKGF